MHSIIKIKTLYEEYKNGTIDKLLVIKELSKLYNLVLNNMDFPNYDIKNFDLQNLTIELINNKDNTLYIASYTPYADLFNYLADKLQFIKVFICNNHRNIESLYFIGDNRPVISKISFKNGEYELIFEQEMPNSIGSFKDGKKMTIKYVKNMIFNGNEVQQVLLNKKYITGYLNEKSNNSFEKTFTYYTNGSISYIYPESHFDKYLYKKNDSIIYGINDLRHPSICRYLRGICVENSKDFTSDYFPLMMVTSNYSALFNNSLNSAMIFECKTDDNIYHFLEIYKDNIIRIKYHSEKRISQGKLKKTAIDSFEYKLPVILKGLIKSEEIENIINLLEIKISSKDLVSIFSNELNIFKSKINNKIEIDDELDLLSPKLLIDKSILEISKEVTENLDFYFTLIQEQFEETTNIRTNENEVKSNVLKVSRPGFK